VTTQAPSKPGIDPREIAKRFDPREQGAKDYLAALPPEERREASHRINMYVKLAADIDSVDPFKGGLEVVTARHAIENPRPPVLGLWGDWMVPGEASGIVARGGVGKTTFTRNLMLQSACGEGEFCGKAFHAGPVRWLYCTREGSGGWWLQSLHRTAEAVGMGNEVLDRIVLANWADDCGLYLTTDADVDRLRVTLGQLREDDPDGPLAAAFDPFTDFKAGSDQDDEAMQAAFASIKSLCAEFHVAAWVPHHASQNGHGLDASRGSTKYEGTVATQLNLTDAVKDSRGKAMPETVRKLQAWKVRYGRKSTHYLDFDQDTEVYTERAKPGVTSDAVSTLQAAGDAGASVAEIIEETGASDSAAREVLKGLEGEGKAEIVDPDAQRGKRWRLTSEGNKATGLGVS
jgi:hypothetical protein